MAVNLSRNTKVYFSTTDTPTLASTFEIQVLDGYSFSQAVDASAIQVSEAGQNPVRGQRSFNNKLNPAEWSFSTYVRPNKPTNVTAPEKYLWNAAMGRNALDSTGVAISAATSVAPSGSQTTYTVNFTTGAAHGLSVGDAARITGITGGLAEITEKTWTVTAVTDTTHFTVDLETTVAPTAGTPVYTSAKVYKGQWHETTSSAITSTYGSNVNQLQSFWLFFVVDNTTYKLSGCAVNQAEISFDITGIATIAWSGMATNLTEVTAGTINPGTNATAFSLTAASDNFITNKLSTIVLKSNIGGSGTTYTVPITGGTFTYNNNIEFVTPDTLGSVDAPIGYFTGTRSVSGNLTAYLKTGTNESSTLLKDMLTAAASTTEPAYYLEVSVGGKTNTTRVELLMNGVSLQIPSVDVQDVVSTTINFNAQGHYNSATTPGFDLSNANDLVVTYYHA